MEMLIYAANIMIFEKDISSTNEVLYVFFFQVSHRTTADW